MKMNPAPRPPTPRRAPRRMVRPLHARAAVKEDDFEDYDSAAEPSMKLSHAFVVVLVLHILAVGGVFAFNTLKTRQAPLASKPPAAAAAKPSEANAPAAVAPKAAAPSKPAAAAAREASAPAEKAGSHTVLAGDTLTRIATQHKTTVEAVEKANGLDASATIRVGQVLLIPAPGGVPASKPGAAKPVATPAAKPVAAKEAPAKPAASPAAAAAVPATAAAAKPAASPSNPAPAASGATYTVAKGDNPYSIAKKLKVSYSELIKTNKIEDPTKLQIGQVLVIP